MATANSNLTLSFHKGSGQYCKVVNGRRFFLGRDHDTSLETWLRHRADFAVGVDPRKSASRAASRLTLHDGCNMFLDRRQKDIQPATWQSYKYECRRLVDFFGGDFLIANLTPDHFIQLRNFYGDRSPVSVTNCIRRVKALFNWLAEREYIEPVKFGPDFKPPAKNIIKRHRRQQADRCLSADEFLAISNECGLQLRAAVFLALNAGYGPTDIIQVPKSVIDFENAEIVWHRGKTEEDRIAPLWPETIEALLLWDKYRLKKTSKQAFDFKAAGNVSRGFHEALKKAGRLRPGATFYACRHTLATVGRGANDDSALRVIMGHSDDSMLHEHYTHEFPRDRLEHVSEHVRTWLFAGAGR